MGRPRRSIAKSITDPELQPPPQTIEEKEIELRQERAEKTPFRIKVHEDSYFPFTTYEVKGGTNVTYTVEIRSLTEKVNSCSCPDYKVNTLESCKHIEATLNFIRNAGKRNFSSYAKTGSNRIEIFLKQNGREACVRWPQNEEGLNKVRALLRPYLSASQTKLIDPVMGAACIENALEGSDEEVASKIRLSSHLMEWKTDQLLVRDRENDRRQFMDDVKEGKRSLQMLSSPLLPYQEQGMLHLAFQGKAILADDMGLGKTIQAIAACELLRRLNRAKKVLVVTPASLKGEWEEQIARFIGLPTLLVTGPRGHRLECYKRDSFFYLANYEQIRNDYAEIQSILNPDILILDEAQRIKNWQTKTAWSVKQLKTPYAFVLSGTPIENRIEEIYSIMQVVDSKILGPLYKFQQDFYSYNENNKPTALKNLNELHRRLSSVVLRRRKKDVEEQLPERTVNNFLVEIGPEQKVRYQEYSDRVARLLHTLKKRPLTPDESKRLQQNLACMRMIVDTPYILDEKCRECPKLEELEEILAGLMEDETCKVIIFSEWERMLHLVRELVKKLGFDFAWHTGSVPQDTRRADIKRFKEDPNCRLFLTTDSGSTGLNLQVANVVINLDLPWNPAKLEQRIARAWRKNQSRVVQVINLIAENTIEHRMLTTLAMKQAVADAVLDAMGDISELDLCSSRQDFIEKLEILTGQSATYQITPNDQKKKLVSPDEMKQDILGRHSDRIHLLELHQGKMLAVVDKADPPLKQSLSESAQGPVEVLDFETYTTLKRLVEAGLIQFTNGEKSILFKSQLIQADLIDLRTQKLEKATNLYKEAERKLQMVSLLKSGGFALEALPAAGEVFHKGMEILKVFEKAPDPMALQLKEELNNPQHPDASLNALFAWMENISSMMSQYALGIES